MNDNYMFSIFQENFSENNQICLEPYYYRNIYVYLTFCRIVFIAQFQTASICANHQHYSCLRSEWHGKIHSQINRYHFFMRHGNFSIEFYCSILPKPAY